MPSSTSSSDEHAVAIGEEPISGLDRMTVGGERVFSSGKRAHQHQQGRLRQVKIGEQRLDYVQGGARGEEDVCGAGMGLEAVDAGTVLQHADRRGAGGHDAPAFAQRVIDLQRGFIRQRVPFRMETDLCHLRHPHWLERAQPDMERQVGDEHASGADLLKNFRGEVQSGGGCGDRAALLRKDRLVTLTIKGLVLTANVWGQRDMPDKLQPGEEIVHRA